MRLVHIDAQPHRVHQAQGVDGLPGLHDGPGLAGTGQDDAVLRRGQQRITQPDLRQFQCRRRGIHRRPLGQHLFLAVAGQQHVELFLRRAQLRPGRPVRTARVVQFLLGDGIACAHGADAVQIDGRIVGHGTGTGHGGAGLFHFFRAVTALQAKQLGLLSGQLGRRLVPLLAQQVVVQTGQLLPGAHAVAFVHQHLGDTAIHAEAHIHLTDFHITVQHQAPLRPVPQEVPAQRHGHAHKQHRCQNLLPHISLPHGARSGRKSPCAPQPRTRLHSGPGSGIRHDTGRMRTSGPSG